MHKNGGRRGDPQPWVCHESGGNQQTIHKIVHAITQQHGIPRRFQICMEMRPRGDCQILHCVRTVMVMPPKRCTFHEVKTQQSQQQDTKQQVRVDALLFQGLRQDVHQGG